MNEEIKKFLASWLRDNKENKHKICLIQYLQEQICKYSNQDATPAEQVKGMQRLLRDVINLDAEMFEGK